MSKDNTLGSEDLSVESRDGRGGDARDNDNCDKLDGSNRGRTEDGSEESLSAEYLRRERSGQVKLNILNKQTCRCVKNEYFTTKPFHTD